MPDAREPAVGLQPGSRFGRYEIERLLGEGAMGAVFLAYDAALARRVALKVPKFSPDDSDGRARFLREARSAAGLRHPNICPIHDVGEVDGTQFLTMAFIEGRSLADYITPGRVHPLRQIALLVRKLASALGDAHAAGIVHRDLKPANVMVDGRGEPVVMDFGLARSFRGGTSEGRITQSGMVVGSPAYMSPEQVEGTTELGPASDIYSLGVIFYELLTGRLPFDGTLYAIFSAIVNKPPEAPRDFRPDLDEELQAICLRMMAKRAEDRFGSMKDVAEALKRYLAAPPGRKETALRQADVLKAAAERAAADDWDQLLETLPAVDGPASRSRPRKAGRSLASRTDADRDRSRGRRAVVIALVTATLLAMLGTVSWLSRRGNRAPSGSASAASNKSPVDPAASDLQSADGVESSAVHVTAKSPNSIPEPSEAPARPKNTLAGEKPKAPPGQPPAAGSQEPPRAKAPFGSAQAKAHQDTWARHLSIGASNINSAGMTLVLIPPGEFLMGRLPGESDRLPPNGLYQEPRATQHPVSLTKPFLLGTTEVTQRQWRDVVGTEPWKNQPRGAIGDDYPATYTTKASAIDFCRRLSQREGVSYRLPTEAEWEFACRAGTDTIYFFGDTSGPLREYACAAIVQVNGLQTVATRKANPFGLFDMCGNVWEWVADGPQPFGAEAAVDPLIDPSNRFSVIRGSCFRSIILREFSSGARHQWPGSLATDEKGFRVVCEVNDAARKKWSAPAASKIAD